MATKIHDHSADLKVFPQLMAIGEMAVASEGMTLRDYFAAQATDGDVKAIIEQAGWAEPTQTISRQQARYIHADEMLAARDK